MRAVWVVPGGRIASHLGRGREDVVLHGLHRSGLEVVATRLQDAEDRHATRRVDLNQLR